MANYESIYSGASDPLFPQYQLPQYASAQYQMNISTMGMALDPRTANQLNEVNTKMNPGVKHIEVQGTMADVFESIPEPHLKEIATLMRLNKITPSLHAPVIEASGFNSQGGWTEMNRVGAEQQLTSAVLRGAKLDSKGNISVTVHSTAQLPEMNQIAKIKDGEKRGPFYIIDAETGAPKTINRDISYFPEQGEFKEKGREFNAERELDRENKEFWLQNLAAINRYAEWGGRTLDQLSAENKKEGMGIQIDFENKEELKRILDPNFDVHSIKDESDRKRVLEVQKEVNQAQIYLRDSYRGLQGLFDKAYKTSKGEDREKLIKFANEIAPRINGLENHPEEVKELSNVLEAGIRVLGQINTPKTFVPMNEFIIDKSAQTFANVAKNAFDKYGQKAPIINIENPPAGGGLSKAEDLKALVEKSRERLRDNLMKDGVGKSQATETAEKLIGATWDVGHINMLRKSGYSEKDIIKQTEIIAPFVKHVHLSDNFGFEHTELPMGMGNVPIKEIMEKLGEKGFEGKKIIEAGNWWQHFTEQGKRNNPFQPTIEAFGSSAYTSGGALNWGGSGGAFSGYSLGGMGNMMPRVSQTIYGATGFSGLPQELGGNVGGEQSRFSGTPNQ